MNFLKLNGTLKEGNTYIIENNEYPNDKVNIKSSGTKDLPITIQADNVILSNTTTLRITGSNIIFSGFTFRDINVNKMIKLEGDNIQFCNNTIQVLKRDVEFVLGVYGSNVRVNNNTFRHFDKMGVIVNVMVNKDKPNYCLIDNNNFNERKSIKGKNGGEMVRIGDSKTSLFDSKTTLYGNFFSLCSGEIEIVSVKSCKNIIYNNKFINCEGGLCFRHGQDNMALYNYFLGENENSAGIRLTDSGHKLFYNTFEKIKNDNPFRSALSIMCGETDNKLNGYASVLDCVAKFNDFINCENCLSIGVNNKRKSNILPENLDISQNRFIKCSNMFLTDKKVKGHKNSKITNNKLLKYEQKLNIETTKKLDNINIKNFYLTSYNQDFSTNSVIEEKEPQKSLPEPVIDITDITKHNLGDLIITDDDDIVEISCIGELEDKNKGLLNKLEILRKSFEELYEFNNKRNEVIKRIIDNLK